MPSVVGVDWRVDYSIRSKNAGRENLPMFFISLKVLDNGQPKTIDMIATLEQLNDLLSKVSVVLYVSSVIGLVQLISVSRFISDRLSRWNR